MKNKGIRLLTKLFSSNCYEKKRFTDRWNDREIAEINPDASFNSKSAAAKGQQYFAC